MNGFLVRPANWISRLSVDFPGTITLPCLLPFISVS
jgi:hypothetical protein